MLRWELVCPLTRCWRKRRNECRSFCFVTSLGILQFKTEGKLHLLAECLQELRSAVELLQKALAIDVAWIARYGM